MTAWKIACASAHSKEPQPSQQIKMTLVLFVHDICVVCPIQLVTKVKTTLTPSLCPVRGCSTVQFVAFSSGNQLSSLLSYWHLCEGCSCHINKVLDDDVWFVSLWYTTDNDIRELLKMAAAAVVSKVPSVHCEEKGAEHWTLRDPCAVDNHIKHTVMKPHVQWQVGSWWSGDCHLPLLPASLSAVMSVTYEKHWVS